MKMGSLVNALAHFPWKSTAFTLRERFREDRLGLTASSLTFTTVIALVPFFTVALAVFTAFPIFAKLQDNLQSWLVQSLIPEAIARQVIGYLNQFAGKASRLGAVGLAFLFITALALVLTIDRTLNSIWRVRRPRPLAQRVLIYWAVMTLGPLLLGALLSIGSYVMSASRGLVGVMPGGVRFTLDLVEFFLLATGLAALYRFVPHAPVRSAHAWTGALFATIGIEAARKLLALYLGSIPTYAAVYGAFATVPIFLVWIYLLWLVVLFGAVIAAYLPALLGGIASRENLPGWRFQLAIDVLRELDQSRSKGQAATDAQSLSARLRVDPLDLEAVLQVLRELDWVGQLEDGRFALIADADAALLSTLAQKLLLVPARSTAFVWRDGLYSTSTLRQALQ